MAKRKWWHYLNPLAPALATYDIVQNKPKKEKAKAEEGMRKTRAKEKLLALKLKTEQDITEKEFEELINNWETYKKDPELLKQLEDRLNVTQDDLEKISQEQRSKGGKAISKLEAITGQSIKDLKRSEQTLGEAQDKSLNIIRNLAKKTTLPGQASIEDRIGETTASALGNIKKYTRGQGGLQALTSLFQNQQNQLTGIGISAAQNKQNMMMNLAETENQYGSTMADLIRTNAGTSANIGSGLYSAYSDYINKIGYSDTRAALNKSNIAGTLYDANRAENMAEYQSAQIPQQLQANFLMNKYQMNNPIEYEKGLLSRDYGMNYANLQTAEDRIAKNNALLIQLFTEATKGVLTGGTSVPAGIIDMFGKNRSGGEILPGGQGGLFG